MRYMLKEEEFVPWL
jgi:hypothetical protein